MAKLFAAEEFEVEALPADKLVEAKIENSDIPDIAEFHEDAIVASTEAFARASNDLFIVGDIKASLESKKLGSLEYFTSIENYSLYMKSISNNLGVKAKMPSLEDFKNPYGTKASHQFVMEGFMEFMRSIWEKIKSFFKEFWKRILLFLKRLVNANLEMEEYEQYIEDLMHKVKRSDKSRVEVSKTDSKLPKILTDFGAQELTTDYLLSKGRTKLTNLARMIDIVTDKAIPSYLNGLSAATKEIHSKFTKDYKPTPETAADFTSTMRARYNEEVRGLFSYNTGLKSLPDDAYNSVMSSFDGDQLDSSNASFYSLTSDSDSMSSLPNNYNLYLTISNFSVPVGNRHLRTSKVNICTSKQPNTQAVSSMNLISDRMNLLKFYDFYKDYSKQVNIKKVESRIEKLYDTVQAMIKNLEEPFGHALESHNDGQSPDVMSGIAAEPLDMPDLSGHMRQGDMVGDIDTGSASTGNPDLDRMRMQTKEEIREFQKYVFGYMNVIQTFMREFSVSILGTYQETRYELIKYLYKSAKQF